jgi:hypothetical protein
MWSKYKMPPRVLSDLTLKQYSQRLALLQKDDVPFELAPLLNYFRTRDLGGSTQKLYLSAIKHSMGEAFPEDLQKLLTELYVKQNDKEMEQKLSAKQVNDFVDHQLMDGLVVELVNKEGKTEQEWQDLMLLALYTLNAPVRADYGSMKIHSRAQVPSTKEKNRYKGNFMIWRKDNPAFVFQDYKTSATYGRVTIPLRRRLINVMRDYLGHFETPQTELFPGWDAARLSAEVINATRRRLRDGRAPGISLLRHSYIVHFWSSLETIADKEELAARMMHSRDQQEKYRSLNVAKD